MSGFQDDLDPEDESFKPISINRGFDNSSDTSLHQVRSSINLLLLFFACHWKFFLLVLLTLAYHFVELKKARLKQKARLKGWLFAI